MPRSKVQGVSRTPGIRLVRNDHPISILQAPGRSQVSRRHGRKGITTARDGRTTSPLPRVGTPRVVTPRVAGVVVMEDVRVARGSKAATKEDTIISRRRWSVVGDKRR